MPGDEAGPAANKTRIWDHDVDWQPDVTPQPTSFDVSVNATRLQLEVTTTTTGTCGLNTGEPGSDSTNAYAEFVSPQGETTSVELLTGRCTVASLTLLQAGSGDWASQAGTWKVSFHGRGLDLHQHFGVVAILD